MLAPAVDLAAVRDVSAVVAVVPDRCEQGSVRIVRARPQIEVDGLPRLDVAPAVEWDAAVGSAVVLAVRRDRVMVRERDPRVLVAVRQPELGRDRVGLDVDPERRLELLVAEIGGADDVQQGVTGSIEGGELCWSHAEAGSLPVGEPEGPAVAETDPGQRVADVADCVGAVVGYRVLPGVVRPDGVVLDVPDIVPEPLEPAEPVQVQPRLPAERRAAHHAEDDELQRRHAIVS